MGINYKINHCSQAGIQLFLLLLLCFVLWLSLAPVPSDKPPLINDKLAHFIAYAVLAANLDHAFATTRFTIKKFFFLFSYGVLIEILQHFTPTREFSLLDMLANTSGMLFYLLLTYTLLKRELTEKPSN